MWIQRIDDLKIKPIKGKDNPADLGTKSLTRDKIRKYMLTIGYIGDYLEEGEPVDDGEVDVRMAQGKRKVDEVRLQRIIQAVTMAVLIGLGEAHKEASKSMPESEDDEGTGPTMCIVLVSAMVFMCICRTLLSAAILLKSRVKGKVEKRKVEREEKEKGLEKRKKRRRMSGEGEKILEFAASGKWALEDYEKEVKLLIREECRSIEATTAMERWLKEISREQFEHPTKLKAVIKESNKTRQDEATPESRMMMRLEVTLRRALTVMTIKAKEQERLDLETRWKVRGGCWKKKRRAKAASVTGQSGRKYGATITTAGRRPAGPADAETRKRAFRLTNSSANEKTQCCKESCESPG